MKQYVISVLVSNHLGVIARVASLFFHHGFSIDSFAVSETKQDGYSRITVSMSGDDYARDRMMTQLWKLHDVKAIEEMNPEKTISRELLMVKVRALPENKRVMTDIANKYDAKIIDESDDMMCIQLTDTCTSIDEFVKKMEPYKITEMCRTGVIALEKGKNYLSVKKN